jgi:hypothetical protein
MAIPAYVSSIGYGAFCWCSSLQEFSVSEVNENYTSVDGALYNKDISTMICCPGGKSGEFLVPETVTTIGAGAFERCESLTSIVIPAVTSIESSAFFGCKSLVSIDLGASVISIESHAFNDCRSLTSIVIPATVTSIGYCAFYECQSLITFICLNPEPPTLDKQVFGYCPVKTIYVPDEAVEAYKAANEWKNYNIVGIGTSGIEDAIFCGDVFGGNAFESATVYTLQGVRVKGVRTMDDVKSLTPGLYVVNGKKVFVK